MDETKSRLTHDLSHENAPASFQSTILQFFWSWLPVKADHRESVSFPCLRHNRRVPPKIQPSLHRRDKCPNVSLKLRNGWYSCLSSKWAWTRRSVPLHPAMPFEGSPGFPLIRVDISCLCSNVLINVLLFHTVMVLVLSAELPAAFRTFPWHGVTSANLNSSIVSDQKSSARRAIRPG